MSKSFSFDASFHAYGRLMRLDKPTGILLLMWPCWWSVALAGGGRPLWDILALFALGALLMRAAGCILNDLADREIDRQVARTRMRPLASGEVTVREALWLLLLLLLLSLGVAWMLGEQIVRIAACWLLPVVLYPYMKRITWWPQLFLGITFNAGAILGWVAVQGEVTLTPLLLYLGCIFWTLGYDTVYALQDMEDDRRIGVKSTALRLGRYSKRWVACWYGVFLLCLLAAMYPQVSLLTFCLLIIAGLWLYLSLQRVDAEDTASCMSHFKQQSLTGAMVFIILLLFSSHL